MAPERQPPPSFSAGRRLSGWLHAIVGVLAVAALVVMVNYLADRHSSRWFLSSQQQLQLHGQTLGLLRSLTNEVAVTVYYDRQQPYFSTVLALLREYHLANPRIRVRVVDYIGDAGAAQEVFAKYLLAGVTNKNLIIFDCAGRSLPVDGDALMQSALEAVSDSPQDGFLRKPVAFHGEKWFTLALLTVTSPKPLKVYFLAGHDEHATDSGQEIQGYLKFASLLRQNALQTATLSLTGTNAVPSDCNLLVVGGPLKPIPADELEKIERYLAQGGRLLALFNSLGAQRLCGLEGVLTHWGVDVGTNAVADKAQSTTRSDYDLKVYELTDHPVVRPLKQASPPSAIHLIRPRVVARRPAALQSADAPTVEEIARSSTTSTLVNDPRTARPSLPLVVAVEKGAVKGVVTERGTTRLIVVGDSFFLGNQMIESAGNRDFAAFAVNWLLDRSQLLRFGPQAVTEFRLALSQAQMQSLQWLLLAGLPGAVLLLGGLVWLRRRR